MTADNDPNREPTIFSAIITPNRSLSARGFLIFMLMLGGISFATGMVFLSPGAWPVFGFFGLDVLLVYWAFRLNYRARPRLRAGDGHAVRADRAQGEPHGRMREWTLNPVWVRLERDDARGVRHRAAVPGLARPPAADRGLPRAAGEGHFRCALSARWARPSAARRGR